MTYWPARSPVLIALVAAAGALLLAWNISLLFKLLTSPDIAAPGDFSALWSIGRFVLAHGFHGLYDSETLNAFRHDLGDLDEIAAPYLYPPPFALFMALFALLPLRTAYFAFMGLTLALYLWAATKGSWRWSLVLLALPTTAIALAAGQNGFLTGALLLGGLRLRETRPILAGILFGALAYKPQLRPLTSPWRATCKPLTHAPCFGILLVNQPQQVLGSVALGFQFAVLFGNLGLLGQMGKLLFQFKADVVHAQQVLARIADAQLGFAAAVAVF